MIDAVECHQIALRLRDRLRGEACDELTLAHVAGLWLEPTLGAQTSARGRVVVFDPRSTQSAAEVGRCAVRFLLHAEGFDDQQEPALIDEFARELITYSELPTEAARTAS